MTAISTRAAATFAAVLSVAVLAFATPASASVAPTEPTAAMAAIGVDTPPPPVDACVALTRQLHPGDDGADVSCLQTQLVAAQIPLVELTGEFDEPTRLAVETWQTLNGLTVDGWVGGESAPTLGFIWAPPAPPAAAPPASDTGSADAPVDAPPVDPSSCLADVRAGAAAVANAMNMPLADIATGDLDGDAGSFWGSSDLSFGDITIDCTTAPLGGWYGVGSHEQSHWVVLASGLGNSECATESVAYLLTGSDSGFYNRCDQQGQEAIDLFRHYWGQA